MKNKQDYSKYIGQTFGRLTVVDYKSPQFVCVCSCGRETRPYAYQLLKGSPQSCRHCSSKSNISSAQNARTLYSTSTTCSFCGAVGNIEAKGLCRKCYYRALHSGTPEYYVRKTPVRVTLTEEERAQRRQECINGFNFNPENEIAVKWAEMYKNGMSMQQIGNAFGVSRQRVSAVLKGKKK